MAKLFMVSVATQTLREVPVVAETSEEAQTKLTLAEGEAVAKVEEKGDVTL